VIFTSTPAQRADALRAFARAGRRCWRCRARVCIHRAWSLCLPEETIVICETCFRDAPGTIAAVDARTARNA
jgi:hypothetical protein